MSQTGPMLLPSMTFSSTQALNDQEVQSCHVSRRQSHKYLANIVSNYQS